MPDNKPLQPARLRARVSAAVTALLVGLAGFAAAVPAQLAAQEGTRTGRGVVAGAVLDAVSGAPLEGATVVLQPETVGAFPGGPAAGSPFAAATRAAASDRTGGYRFEDLPAGVYRVYVTRIGYRPYSVVVELRGAVETAVSIGLHAEPIRLPALRTVSVARGPYEAADRLDTDAGLARLLAADLTRRNHLTTDVRELTHADVVEAVTLGEPDLFRALQRLPGVTTRSDYTAELWTRGAPWSQTRVYFDGVPLFNPLHALGVVSGIGSSAVGAVWFHPGARSAGIGEGAAGVVDLQSRRASGGGELNVNADLSLMSGALALDQRVLDGRAGWMLAGRRTYLDWLTEVARRTTGQEDASFPYGFAEVAGKVDVWLGERTALEASWLWETDHLGSNERGTAEPLRAEWGNTAARVSLTSKLRGLNVRQSFGLSQHGSVVLPERGERLAASPTSGGYFPNTRQSDRQSESTVAHYSATGAIWPEPASLAGPAWTLGYALEVQTADYFGPAALPVPRHAVAVPEYSLTTGSLGSLIVWEGVRPMGAVWAERTWTPEQRLTLRTGLRVEAGSALRNAPSIRPSSRVSFRYAPLPEVAVSGGYSRVFQYTQSLAPAGVHVASLVSTDVWLLASSSVPAIRSDIVTLGTEAWLAPGRVVSLNGFGRLAGGMALPDPRSGHLFDRPLFVIGENRAYGVEAAVRQLVGPVTGSASYTLSRSRIDAAGLTYDAPADRTHVLNTTTMLRVQPGLRVGGAFTAATGVPFTRAISDAEECAAVPDCNPARLPWIGEPHAARAPNFASLDLLLDWATRAGGVELGAFIQLRNVLGRDNATVYTGGLSGCHAVGCERELANFYERGIPRLPVVGLRVRR